MSGGDDFPASGSRRGRGLVALSIGLILLLFALVVTIGFVGNLLADDSDLPIIGFVFWTTVTIPSGLHLIRRGRRLRQGTHPLPGNTTAEVGAAVVVSASEDLEDVRGSMRHDKARFWGLVFSASVGVIALTVLRVGIAESNRSAAVLGGLIAGVSAATAGTMVWRGRQTRTPDPIGLDGGPVRFRNIAFSDREPTWRGWRRDTGVLTVHPDRVIIDGLKGQIVIEAPLWAELHTSRWMMWQMVKIVGSLRRDELQGAVYLVGEGAPRSKFAADPADIEAVARTLRNAINNR